MRKLKLGLKGIGRIYLVLVLLLLSGSLSAEDAETELLQILSSYEQITTDLEGRFQTYDQLATDYENWMMSARKNLSSLKSNSLRQTKQLSYLEKSLSTVQETQQTFQKQINVLENSYNNMEKNYEKLKGINNILIGVSLTALTVAGVSFLF